MKILLANFAPNFSEILSNMLKQDGFTNVVFARGGGILFEERKFDLVFFSYPVGMIYLNGLRMETCKNAAIPFILVVAESKRIEEYDLRRLSAVQLILPFSHKKVEASIAAAFFLHR